MAYFIEIDEDLIDVMDCRAIMRDECRNYCGQKMGSNFVIIYHTKIYYKGTERSKVIYEEFMNDEEARNEKYKKILEILRNERICL